ncbi:maleylpyruvate isomerase family mycothiol-dependent enzyme [Arthrobacter sp. ISL-5]|uniref:maleylpyruvate isomerase family mycothiol-dependent enzyme n=1 Tax=Arthrobacter sp. ISL-5 TaxID=2819111 RepID=UPI001BE77B41|nr:maleylpyruvate isomerase family mycothiol-dependent enzyme [Arthrobacter sp. ISL-5]MBT2552546.1 maleylpyruvate isomerase family mycothiol-dependent enzyme [Arthrobacter sp. ISL-5]
MANRLPAPDLKNLHAAFRTESTVMLEFANSLTTSQWNAPSKAAGWSIADMVGHIGSTAHNMYSPAGLQAARQPSLEAVNEGPVEVRRAWSRQQVMAEFETATRTSARMLAFVRRTPLRAVPMQLNELGKFPMALLVGGALVFDLHTHLRHDMAPALGLPTPPTDANRMLAVLDWMTAVLSNQTGKSPAPGIDAGLTLTLTGPGGGTWWIDADGLATPGTRTPAARVTAPAITFPDWGTQRSSWRDADVEMTGDTELAARYLDTVNVI